MARTTKVDNALLKRLARTEEKRRTEFRTKRKYYLIVCEGEKTEPLYFEGMKKDLPKGVLDSTTIDIDGTGTNTLWIIEEALRIASLSERKYDQIWAVFDRDSFPASNFNNAISKVRDKNVHCAWSNEAFELWYLLHFNYHDTGISRVEYGHLIERELTDRLGRRFEYRKNSKEMYEILKTHGNMDQAIKWAKKLDYSYRSRTDYANQNPCTKVYKLVQELCKLADESSCKG